MTADMTADTFKARSENPGTRGLRTLQLPLRFMLPLLATLAAAAYLAVPVTDRLTLDWVGREVDSRNALVAAALSDSIAQALGSRTPESLRPALEQVLNEPLRAVGLCSAQGELLLSTARFPASLNCAAAARLARQRDAGLPLPGGTVHVGVRDLLVPVGASAGTASLGRLVLLHDMSFIARRSQDIGNYLIGLMAALGLLMALVTVAVAQLSWRGWIAGARALLQRESLAGARQQPALNVAPELTPFADDLRARLRELEDEFRRSHGAHAAWTAERLRTLLRTQLAGDQVIVVSNREPYIHERSDAGISVRRPASGLVTAVEPVMRACSGTWVAHGSGNGDRDVVDDTDRVAVPPGHHDYALRRIWLSEEEEQGYYYGFANEGMWPLCHVAHVRPVFRESDWAAYRAVNQRFADAVVAEARSEDPIVLVQDYHFALLPAMVREQLPNATILTFWHIPWPNPESFGICPWREEILQGMLGSSILGFHTPFHCRNFIDTVDRFLEARIEHENSAISFREKETLVESYPISIDWPGSTESAAWPSVAQCRQRVRERLALSKDACVAVGVDRCDYTKGILERLNAVERLLEKWPEWVGRFVFIQVAAPTRGALDEYRTLHERIVRVTDRINERFGRKGASPYQPVHLLFRHHERAEVTELFRAADCCVVTSLHDGMNLVCKEFVAARDDLQGVLVLSRFAGAARELSEALIVNPYHVEETADAMHRAITMPVAEQRERMAALRSTVREFNVFRWAGRMLTDAGRWRLRARTEARVRRHQAG